jgi:hypothetical protein
LNAEALLWIEYFPTHTDPIQVASFLPRAVMGSEKIYTVTWRTVRPNELSAVAPYIPEIQEIEC